MGIRYSAYPVRSDEIDLARRDPRHYIHCVSPVGDDDPYDDDYEKHLFLYLGKEGWYEMQRLFGAATEDPHGWGMELVGRSAREDSRLGRWIRSQVLTPEEVGQISHQIGQLDTQSIIAAGFEGGEVEFVAEYLEKAQRFTAECVDRGYGLISVIG